MHEMDFIVGSGDKINDINHSLYLYAAIKSDEYRVEAAENIKKCVMNDAPDGFNFVYIENEGDDEYFETVNYTWEGITIVNLEGNSYNFSYEAEDDVFYPY